MSGSIVDDSYVSPTSWSGLDGTFSENGDYAGWVDAIRSAMWERVDVCLGLSRGSQLRTFINGLGYFQRSNYSNNPHGYRGDCEIYEFAKETELILDYLLTPYREYGTVNNDWGPSSEQGFFVHPDHNYWLKRITYGDDSSSTGETTCCYVKFLNLETVFDDADRNYKLALSGVARGDTPDRFVPFFEAVKNALNFMTVIPVGVRGVRASAGSWKFADNIGDLQSDMREAYREAMEDQPDPNYLSTWNFNQGSGSENSCRITNSAHPQDTNDSYSGRAWWYHSYPYQVITTLPPISFNLHRAYWACMPQTWVDSYDSAEFCFGSEYSPQHDFVGLISGYGHYLGGDDGKHYGAKFPSDTLQFPQTPGREQSNITGYELHTYYFADFNVSNGFNFR